MNEHEKVIYGAISLSGTSASPFILYKSLREDGILSYKMISVGQTFSKALMCHFHALFSSRCTVRTACWQCHLCSWLINRARSSNVFSTRGTSVEFLFNVPWCDDYSHVQTFIIRNWLTDLKNSRDPPPAATVLMSSWGACRVTPAVVASNTCSYWPAYRLTSVDVPERRRCIKGEVKEK